MVIPVKKDQSVKIPLDSRLLKVAILKNKYQMPNLENWMKKEAEIVNATERGDVFSTSLDMQYAFEQTVLRPESAKHCNFQIVVEESTGTYAFNTVFYGLTKMPPEVQIIMDNILTETKNTFTFIDDNLIVTKDDQSKIKTKDKNPRFANNH